MTSASSKRNLAEMSAAVEMQEGQRRMSGSLKHRSPNLQVQLLISQQMGIWPEEREALGRLESGIITVTNFCYCSATGRFLF